MKYGPIICDPNSEEARKLIGKVVCVSDSFNELSMNMGGEIGLLFKIDDDPISTTPFVIDMNGSNLFKNHESFTFIREVIEEKPKYRPYKDTEEMIKDFKNRFCKHTTIPQYSLPLIWIENRNVRFRFLVSTFGSDAVHVEGSEVYSWLSMENLFRYMNYLDGSPVGKEVTQ